MTDVFLDSIGLLALWNIRDQWHPQAAQTFTKLVSAGANLWTTEYILLECGNAASRTSFRSGVVELREQFLAEGKLIVPTDADRAQAWAAYARETPGQAGIVDHISFVVMRRLGISDAFTNDRHFAAAGFNPVF
jgi:predicted nucleic acid-binding protein